MNEFKLLPKIFNWQKWRDKIDSTGGYTPPYKVYTALLTQTGTDAPVATVLENTIGDIWFTYNDVGVYNINSDGLFTDNKTFVNISPTVQDAGNSISQTVQFVGGSESTINTLVIQTVGAGQDGIPNNTPIEIRVYN